MKTKTTYLVAAILITASVAGTVDADPMPKHVSSQAQEIVCEVAEDRIFDAAVALRAAALYDENAGDAEDATKLHAEADKALDYIKKTTGYTDRQIQQKIAAAEVRVIEQSRDKADEHDGH